MGIGDGDRIFERSAPEANEQTPLVQRDLQTGDDMDKPELGILTKVLYGFPQYPSAALNIPIQIYLAKFYADVVELPMNHLAIAMAIAKAIDALLGPVTGWLSDNKRIKCGRLDFGRRIPYVLFCSLTSALVFVVLFNPPNVKNAPWMILWFGVSLTLFLISFSAYWIPYVSLGAELTPRYDERTTLFAIKEGFSLSGIMTAALVPGLLLMEFKDNTPESKLAHRRVYSVLSIIIGGFLVSTFVILALRVKEKQRCTCTCSIACRCGAPPEHGTANPLIPGLRRALRNRPFTILIPVFIVGNVTLQLVANMLPFFVTYVLRPTNEEMWLSIYLGTLFASGFVSVPIWVFVSWHIGKKAAFLTGSLIMVLSGVVTFFVGQGGEWVFFALQIVFGLAGGGWNFLLLSMQSDVIDYEEFLNGSRREGQFFTLWSLLPKFLGIPVSAMPFTVLSLAGYRANVQPQTDDVIMVMKTLQGLAPALLSLIGLLVFLKYPISRDVHHAVQKGIQAHKDGLDYLDPITGANVYPPPPGKETEMGWFLDNFTRYELLDVFLYSAKKTNIRGVAIIKSLFWATLAFIALWLFASEISFVPEGENNLGLVAVLSIVLFATCCILSVVQCMKISPTNRLRKMDEEDLRTSIRSHLQSMGYGIDMMMDNRKPNIIERFTNSPRFFKQRNASNISYTSDNRAASPFKHDWKESID